MWVAISLVAVATIVWCILSFLNGRRPSQSSQTVVQSTVERIREIGDLCVLEANLKEIVTHKKKGGFLTSDGKMLLICEFTVEFRYDLRTVQFERNPGGQGYSLIIPPHFYKINTGEIKLYHEEKAAFLGLLPMDFSIEERNQIIIEAREAAKQQALASLKNNDGKIQMSAATTLKAIIGGCGVKELEFKFINSDSGTKQINSGTQNL